MSINIDEWKIENNLYRSLLIALYTRLDTIQKPYVFSFSLDALVS